MKKSSLKFKKVFEDNLSSKIEKSYVLNTSKAQEEEIHTIKRKRSKVQMNNHEKKRPQSATTRNKSLRTYSVKNFRRQFQITNKGQENMNALTKDIQRLLNKISSVETEIIRQQLQKVVKLLQKTKEKFRHKFKEFEDNLSKQLKNRVSHLIFFIIFANYLENTNIENQKLFEEEIKKLILCEYYSRKLELHRTTLFICMRIQELYIEQKKYEESKRYARKCLRLAVFMRDRDSEFKVIENFKIINYYTGVISAFPQNYITKKQRKFIWQTYHPQDQLPEIFEGKKRDPSVSYIYDFENSGNFIDKPQFSRNCNNFKRNYNSIKKNMIEISKNVQKTLKKVSKVGVLHKYIDENTYITLQPRSPNTLPQNQGQVLLTHKKRVFSDNINEEKFVSVYLPRFTKMLKEFCEQ